MYSELFRIPGLDWPIHGYGLMIVIGFLLAASLANREARRRGLPDFVFDMGFVMLFCGIMGGRLFYYIQFYQEQFSHRSFLAFFKIWEGGLVFYGGGIGGFLGALLYLRSKRFPMAECLDTTAPFVPIGMGFGRLGCLLNGCCYGKICSGDFIFGLSFPAESEVFKAQVRENLVPGDGLAPFPVYPVQLYEAAYDFLLFALLLWYSRSPAPRMTVFPLLFVLYGIGRFSLEFLRGDNAGVFLNLTISQTISLVMVAVFFPLFIYLWKKSLGEAARLETEKT